MMFTITIIAVLVALVLAVARALVGSSTFDRLLAANFIGTLAILLLAVFGFLTERPEFLDVGLVYAFLNVTGTYAVLKFFRYGELGREQEDTDNEGLI